jgi:hypothetical protein
MDKSWGVYEVEDDYPYVAPINDLLSHNITRDCWCNPTEYDKIVVHHSADLREDNE